KIEIGAWVPYLDGEDFAVMKRRVVGSLGEARDWIAAHAEMLGDDSYVRPGTLSVGDVKRRAEWMVEPESIGPLPDGTTITVEPTTWDALDKLLRKLLRVLRGIDAPTMTNDEVLAAVNTYYEGRERMSATSEHARLL